MFTNLLTGFIYVCIPGFLTLATHTHLPLLLTPQMSKMMKQGWTVVDVRLAGDFAKQHAAGSVSVPLFRYVEGDTVWDNLKRLAMAGFAMKATGEASFIGGRGGGRHYSGTGLQALP